MIIPEISSIPNLVSFLVLDYLIFLAVPGVLPPLTFSFGMNFLGL